MNMLYSIFQDFELNKIKPKGWLEKYLQTQKSGLTGHLEAAGFPFDTVGWHNFSDSMAFDTDVADVWWPYEQAGYWIDGMVRCGLLLDDEFLLNKAYKSVDFCLNNTDDDGYLGPKGIKSSDGTGVNRWAHVVFFRALIALADTDARIVPALEKHYLAGGSEHYYFREVLNVEIMLWVYSKTGNKALLDMAKTAYEKHDREWAVTNDRDTAVKTMLSDRKPTEHGVSYCELSKIATIMYIYTGKKTYLDAAINVVEKLIRDHILVSGVCSGSEHLRGKTPLDNYETCDIPDLAWNLGYLLQATGNVKYADMIERICFNAAPGAVTNDFRALQYFSCPNQVIADKNSNHNIFFRGEKWMSYRPNPGTECCPGNVNRTMPNFASKMWMKDKNGAYVAAMYSPCVVELIDKNNNPVTVIEDTNYPFSDEIKFTINCDKTTELDFSFRIPTWAKDAKITVKGHESSVAPGKFENISGEFSNGDEITLKLPMSITTQEWGENGISIERGPLVYSLPIKARIEIDKTEEKSTAEFPAYNMYPESEFNYALTLEDINNAEFISTNDFNDVWNNPPVMLKLKGIEVPGYTTVTYDEIERDHPVIFDGGEPKIITSKIQGKFTLTPPLPTLTELENIDKTKKRDITLVPFGGTTLRITIFPKV